MLPSPNTLMVPLLFQSHEGSGDPKSLEQDQPQEPLVWWNRSRGQEHPEGTTANTTCHRGATEEAARGPGFPGEGDL